MAQGGSAVLANDSDIGFSAESFTALWGTDPPIRGRFMMFPGRIGTLAIQFRRIEFSLLLPCGGQVQVDSAGRGFGASAAVLAGPGGMNEMSHRWGSAA